MEFFNAAKVVRLQSHLGKYLIADSNEESVYQGRSENCKESQWTVELVEGNSHIIRLKSCHGLYLSTSDDPFLLGMTGKKVIQSFPKKRLEYTVEWEPIRDGDLVKLRTKGGKFLRANGAMPPWRNSITYDVPHRTATQDWVLWDVKVVDLSLNDSLESLPTCLSSESSLSSLQDDFADSDSPSRAAQDGMQYLQKAKAIRLQSHHGKYLVADDDEKTVRQSRNGSSHKSHWTVELVKGQNITAIRLKSCHGLYLTGTDEPFLLGVTGKKVIQASDSNNAGFNQWVSIKETAQFIKLRSKDGNFLRANRGMPPYRNSITYDVPHRTLTQNWVLWRVDVVDINLSSLHSSLSSMSSIDFSDDDFAGTPDNGSPSFFSIGFRRTFGKQSGSPVKAEGRMIYYHVANDDGKVDDNVEASSFAFKGIGLEELTEKLEDETGIENIIVCSRNRIDGKIYPLHLALPPNNATMHIVVVPSTTQAAREFVPGSP